MAKKKEKHINELTRKQLITKCRGRGISLGHAQKKIDNLMNWVTEKITQIDELRKKNRELLSEVQDQAADINLWRGRCIDWEDKYNADQETIAALHIQINEQVNTIADCDRIIDADAAALADQEAKLDLKDERINTLATSNAELKQLWHKWEQKAREYEEYARELSEFFLINIGQIINTSKLVVSGLQNISAKHEKDD